MARLFSTRASGLEVISLGSVMAWGAGRIWDVIVTVIIVVITTTITNGIKARMVPRVGFANFGFANYGFANYGEFSSGVKGPASVLFDRYLVVSPFPATGILPKERENDLPPYGKSLCWQVQVLQVPATLFGIHVLTSLPVVKAPMHQGRFHQQQAQLLSARQRARLIVKAPVEVLRRYLSG